MMTNRTTRPALEIDPEFRLSLYWIIAALLCSGLALVVMHDFFGELAKKLTVSLIALLCYGLGTRHFGA